MKPKIAIFLILALPFIYIASCNRNEKPVGAGNYPFPAKLSAFKLFKGSPNDLLPGTGAELLELSSTLFTDYAEKQRLIRLPQNRRMILRNDGLPIFPEGTLLAKTFYYWKDKTRPELGKRLIETRILLLHRGRWQAATYCWDVTQQQALLAQEASDMPVEWTDVDGHLQKIKYHVPSRQECINCHQFGSEIIPIGPKAMNLNRMVVRSGKLINQLEYLHDTGLMDFKINPKQITSLPDDKNKRETIAKRARAYLDINCAHCHSPNGLAQTQSLLLSYKTPVLQSGIGFNKANILGRMGEMGPMHMPKMGTTILDDQGVALIKKYLSELQD